jgi:pimeloyl-ACP methyl ester carboxylesterase
MRRSLVGGLVFVVLSALSAAACDSGDTPTTPSTPSEPSPTITDTFSGNLAVNGGVTFQFSTQAAGAVTATLKSLGPDATVTIGLSLGTWNGTACAVVIANDSILPGQSVLGAVSAAGNLCARVYDAGKLAALSTFEITVVHP